MKYTKYTHRNFPLDAIYFAYKGVFNKQTLGTTMGSPVSLTMIDLVMEDVKEQSYSAFTNPQFV